LAPRCILNVLAPPPSQRKGWIINRKWQRATDIWTEDYWFHMPLIIVVYLCLPPPSLLANPSSLKSKIKQFFPKQMSTDGISVNVIKYWRKSSTLTNRIELIWGSIDQKNPEIMIWNGGFAFPNRDRSDVCKNCWLTKDCSGRFMNPLHRNKLFTLSGGTWDSPGFHLHRFASGKIFWFLQFQACYRRDSWNNCWATMVDWLQAPQELEQFSINANWNLKSKYPILAFLNYSQLSWKE